MKCQWLGRRRVCGRPVGERGQRREVAICDHCFLEYEQMLVKREVRSMVSALKTSAKRKKKRKPKHGRGAQARSKPARYV